MRAIASVCVALACAATCQAQESESWPRPREVVPEDPAPPPPGPARTVRPESEDRIGAPWVWDDEPSFESHVRLSAFRMPWIKLVADVDPFEPDDGILFHAKLRTTDGFGAAIAIGAEHVGLGLLYLYSEHEERRTGDRCRAHAGYLELTFEGAVPPGGPVLLTLGGGIGLGGAVMDFQKNVFDDTGGLSVMLRVYAGLRILERVEVTVGAGAFDWGVPGETIGYGGFTTVGLTLRF